ncbi:MAG: tRNA 2-thiouridine(34) synthase MnmA [Firmicutes bacterium]|nr:tRNA 2-thiouridine(34) synthase MnmA [Bacillota bacterium]
MSEKVMVGMSGGVDSSVAALLLQQQGYEVIGVTMKLRPDEWMQECASGGCCSLDDVEDARRVCRRLGIPHYVMNFTDVFTRDVIDTFAAEYRRGRTPNPCIECNRKVKFEAMLQKALAMGMDYIATGHYARVTHEPGGRWLLHRSPAAKDQSYVLYSLTQEQLAHTLFPLGELEKPAVRALAEAHCLPVAHKADSQEICFVQDNDYAGFIERYTGEPSLPGDFVDAQGNVLGRHRGVTHYTIGQRKGLGVSFGRPMFVTAIDPQRNTVTLGEEGSQYAPALIAERFNWIASDAPAEPFSAQVKVRYQAPTAGATVFPAGDGSVRILFDEPQRSVTPGQAVVLYRNDLVLGGGTIRCAAGA